MFTARITITLRPSILDPQGKASGHALKQLGFSSVNGVRIGKHVEMEIDAATEDEARSIAEEACRKLLANEVMEDFDVDVAHTESVGA